VTLLIDPNGQENNHLWIVTVVWLPELDTAVHAVIVNLTSVTGTKRDDRTCIVTPSDPDAHPFVSKESYVFYAEARKVERTKLDALHASNSRPPVAPELLKRIRAGFHQSRSAPRGFRAHVPRE
jgi:hypothetical protein